VEIPR